MTTKIIRLFYSLLLTVFGAAMLWSCSDDDPIDVAAEASYFVGIEAATDPATDVLSSAISVTEGTISPVNNGFEQPAWMTFLQGPDQIITAGFTSAPEFTSYELENGVLVKGESFFTNEAAFGFDFIDESTMVMVTSPRTGISSKTIYLINTDNMEITASTETNFGDVEEEGLLGFPTDMKVRDDKLFISYYLTDGGIIIPSSNVARVAVFSYPDFTFEKVISDERASNIGRYSGTNALEIDENGDIYTYSPSSLACGYLPTSSNNSAILRIKNGETQFDQSFHIDFETLSGGYKINDMFYMGNGKAVLRVLQEDETNADYAWATYAPNSPLPILSTGIIDLTSQTFTLLEDVPLAGGGWNAAYMIEDGKLYLGVSSSSYASIYEIDPEAGTAIAGATIDGNYAKGIFSLTE
ncbi:MAG: DUF4374 domain-containing protein [Bacteroidota bacterium]